MYPDASIVPVDYDPGASEANQTNRIKLLMTVAKDNLKMKQKEKKVAEKENKTKKEVKVLHIIDILNKLCYNKTRK